MERHIQADNAFMEWMEAMSKNVVHIADAWYAAVKWADAHPNWISVKDYATDELPPLIDEEDPYGESVQVLFVVVLDGVQYINKGTFDYDTGVWHSLDLQCSFCKDDVTHWMPMPELPIVSKSENARIIGTADHIKTALDVIDKKGGKQ